MSYSKQNFRSGDTLYASQLNAMDDEIAALEAEVESTKNMVGSPLTASTAAGMTDQTKIYVYTGSETGYTAGHWYYYNGTAWTDGGVYNSVAVNTDTSLTVSGQAADSKAVGDAIDELDGDLSDVKSDLRQLETVAQKASQLKDSTETGIDLDVSDEFGNVIMRLKDGDIFTKNFDSTDIPTMKSDIEDLKSGGGGGGGEETLTVKDSTATGIDLDISDNAGNVIARIQGGHIQTKNFSSSEVLQSISEIESELFPDAKTTVTVDSVQELLDEIANGTSEVIMIENGTYSVLNVEVTRKVEIVGQSRTGVILTCDGSTDTSHTVTNRHGIRFQKGGALKNLTFNVNDVKYVMHQDNIAVPYDLLVENCTFNRYDDSCNYYFFIGCGCYGTQNISVKNCSFIFSENTHNRVSYGIYWHNWHLDRSQLNALAANVTMENCSCIGCGMAIIQDLASKNVNDVISILNCCSTETAPISSGANGYYLGVPNSDVPYNVLFVINSKIGNMILQDRLASKYDYLGAVVTNFTT